MKKRYSVTIGIPAYNEEGNIGYLLESLLIQKGGLFNITEIIVVCDGCTDQTELIVKKYQKKFPFIMLVNRKIRKGKANALNYIYSHCKGDFLFQPDADIVLKNDHVLETLIAKIASNTELNLVSPRHLPVRERTIWAKLAYFSFVIFMDAAMKFNKGINFYTVMGCSLIRGTLTKSFRYPRKTIGDQTYLFAQVISNNPRGYAFVKNAEVLFRTVGSLYEWRKLALRSTTEDKRTVLVNFNPDIVERYYTMPKSLYISSFIPYFIKNPVLVTGTVLLEMFIRLFPLKKNIIKSGQWETNESSKLGINLSKI